MRHNRTIEISSENIARASKDEDFFLALGACLIIKSTFVNSTISDFSYRKFAKLLSKRYEVAKKIVSLGVNFGLFKFYTRLTDQEKWVTYLSVGKLYDPKAKNAFLYRNKKLIGAGYHTVKFGVITPDNKDGKESAKVFLLSSKAACSKKFDNYIKYQKSTDKLTLSNVCDLLLFSAILPILKGNEKHRNRDLHERLAIRGLDTKYRALKTKKQMESMKNVILDDFEIGEANMQNTGISYRYIVNKFPNLKDVNEYRVGKVIRKYGINDSILEVSENYIKMGCCHPKRHDLDTFDLSKAKSQKEKLILFYEDRERMILEARRNDYQINHFNPATSEVEHIDLMKRGMHAPRKRKELVKGKDGKMVWAWVKNPNRYSILMRMANSYDLTESSMCVSFSHKTHEQWREERQKRYEEKMGKRKGASNG